MLFFLLAMAMYDIIHAQFVNSTMFACRLDLLELYYSCNDCALVRWFTSFLVLVQLASYGIHTIPKDVRATEELLKSSLVNIWNDLKAKLQTETVCVKPARDGCSTGVARLR